MLNEILEKINRANSIAIITHENPDGDAIGSSLGLSWCLKNIGKEVDVIIPAYSICFSKLPGIENVKTEGKETPYDLTISVDVATTSLLSTWVKYIEEAKESVAIDHHASHINFAQIDYVEPKSPACCETLYTMFKTWGWDVHVEAATCLLAGIITDTGGFQYQAVTKRTFDIAGEILEKGVNLTEIYRQVFETKSKANLLLTQRALNRIEFLENDKVTFTYVTSQDELEVNAQNGDYEGIVTYGKSVDGVEVSIFLHQLEDGKFKISLRSNEYVNVAEVCGAFGGGGHIRAAGGKIHATVEEAKELILNEIRKQLK